ncbi:MAG: VOC family protein [Acidobacteriaceae bacterium]|nr:VOC family protein [Acidobacteriaceae bacterium]
MGRHILGIAPQLLVSDLGQAIDYYRDELGFDLDFQYESFYGSVSRDHCALHLKQTSNVRADRESRIKNEDLDAYISVCDIRVLFAELEQRGARILKALESRPWGCLDFYVQDPDGNLLCFSEPLSQ